MGTDRTMNNMTRRAFLASAALGATGLARRSFAQRTDARKHRPNIILCMSDDQGWGDTGYNGHPHLQTPHLDAMAGNGIRFDRWYTAAPVCSPTRGSVLTGRHPFRYGIFGANKGHMPDEELTLAEALKTNGYTTGHFGKWHLGTLTKTVKDGRRGGRDDQRKHYSPPWDNGFDACFSTEVQMPTWDPMVEQKFPAQYWTGPDEWATENLDGDDSRVIMDRAVPFIQRAAASDTPFLAVIWFHTPHEPVRAGKPYRERYADFSLDEQHYYGCVTAMDEQIGRLRAELRGLGIQDETMLWYSSDNGPTIRGSTAKGTAGPFRGHKGQLYEGGVRVPGILEWPEGVTGGRTTDMACSTLDYMPTILDVLDMDIPNRPTPIDGISLLPMLEGGMDGRAAPIAFETPTATALTERRFKLYRELNREEYELYDLLSDPSETKDLSRDMPERVKEMAATLEQWRASCRKSREGGDYQ